jgi:hypothetical protein
MASPFVAWLSANKALLDGMSVSDKLSIFQAETGVSSVAPAAASSLVTPVAESSILIVPEDGGKPPSEDQRPKAKRPKDGVSKDVVEKKPRKLTNFQIFSNFTRNVIATEVKKHNLAQGAFVMKVTGVLWGTLNEEQKGQWSNEHEAPDDTTFTEKRTQRAAEDACKDFCEEKRLNELCNEGGAKRPKTTHKTAATGAEESHAVSNATPIDYSTATKEQLLALFEKNFGKQDKKTEDKSTEDKSTEDKSMEDKSMEDKRMVEDIDKALNINFPTLIQFHTNFLKAWGQDTAINPAHRLSSLQVLDYFIDRLVAEKPFRYIDEKKTSHVFTPTKALIEDMKSNRVALAEKTKPLVDWCYGQK